jgi:hypothetical protein
MDEFIFSFAESATNLLHLVSDSSVSACSWTNPQKISNEPYPPVSCLTSGLIPLMSFLAVLTDKSSFIREYMYQVVF